MSHCLFYLEPSVENLTFSTPDRYQKFFVSLLYHELHASIKRDYNKVDGGREERKVLFTDIELFNDARLTTVGFADEDHVALIVGRTHTTLSKCDGLNSELEFFLFL